jgi:N-acyl-D-amino-acid deacylase
MRAPPPPRGDALARYELVIRGATLTDGSDAPPAAGDLAVAGARIAALAALDPGRPAGARECEARGLARSPGCAGAHTRDDLPA